MVVTLMPLIEVVRSNPEVAAFFEITMQELAIKADGAVDEET